MISTGTSPNITCGPCEEGYYPTEEVVDGITKAKCSKCDPSCKTCSGPLANNCLSCHPEATSNRVYDKDKKTCDPCAKCFACKDDKGKNKATACKCDESCKTCKDAGKENCTDCEDDYKLSGGKNPSTCEPVCHKSCKECTEPGENACKGPCVAGRHKGVESGSEKIHKCLCDEGTFHDVEMKTPPAHCKKCHHTCKTCKGGDKEVNCKSCDASLERGPLDSNDMCPCKNGFYDESTATKKVAKCKKCSDTMKGCKRCKMENNKLVCILCEDGRSITDSCAACLPYTSDVVEDKTGNCVACHETCLACKKANDKT